MGFDDQTIKTKVHCFLADLSNQRALTTYMAWVCYDRDFGKTPAQLDRNLPLRMVAEFRLIVGTKATVNCSQLGNAGIIETFESPNPEFKVRIYRVLDKYRNIDALEGICNLLHCKGVG